MFGLRLETLIGSPVEIILVNMFAHINTWGAGQDELSQGFTRQYYNNQIDFSLAICFIIEDFFIYF